MPSTYPFTLSPTKSKTCTMSAATGSTGTGSRITSNTGMKDAFTPVLDLILMTGDSVKLPALSILTPEILPKGSVVYESCVPFAGSTTI